MDIHRCRFVPYPASAINAVAFSHSSLPTTLASRPQLLKHVQVRLAIGRANGDIEIWNPLNGLWHQELIIPGGKSRSVDGLVWITDADEETSNGKTILGKSRLFSIGYTSAVTEWDLEKAKPKTYASGQHGEIWCLGAQPPVLGKNGVVLPSARKLVAGTVDGNLVLYSTEDDDLKFVKSLIRTPSKNTKMICIAFQTRNVVVVGCSNSNIGVYDIRNGTLLRQMSLGAGVPGAPKSIIAWSVKCLPRGDIVSGDSTGHVCIWDGKTYTQAQRIQSHTQDVLCLAVNADGTQIVSGGMDRRTVLYEPRAGHAGRWSKVFHRRYHAHDVKAMASFEGKGMSVVVSGGPDTSPVVYPFRTAGKENHRVLSHLPQQTNLQSAPKARLVISWWGNEIRIWHLLHPARRLLDGDTTGTDIRKNRKLIAQIQVQGESNITSAAISADGTLLLASTATEVKAFQLHYDGTSQIHIRKVEVTGASHGATKVEISPDSHWAFWVEEGVKIMIARVITTESETGLVHTISAPRKLPRIRRVVPKHLALGGLGSYDRKVSQVAFSPDSKMLSVADLAGYIDSWVLRAPGELQNGTEDKSDTSSSDSSENSLDESEEEAAERWYPNPKGKLLPKLDTAPVVLTFSPGHNEEDGDYTLIAITASKDLFVFNPLRGALSDWSRRNPSSKLPEQFRLSRDPIKGVVWQGPRAWVYGHSFLTMLDLSQDLPEPSDTGRDGAKKGTKRKRHDHNAGAGGKINKEHSLVPQQIKAATAPDSNEYMDVDMDDQKSVGASSAYEDDDDDTDGGELQRLRDDATTNGEDARKEASKPKTWNTYQYRPILGIVPLASKPPKEKKKKNGEAKQETVDTLPPLEVALVERPTWDLDLPARYLADGEWER
ncbi:quinon protein alcohol dehydrogenase-like superfamily [Immersiella caudata]|uniref:Quinon protein alcohol dehydrogenase-like superfamily n=1 Tax=Immersiella caudata TaxID=314043 RepID=A0AA39XD78_9PEZI|nr:quinon protein alcohol dehydrogenase-like superfamily [Immersiella caudata]